jgi:hypothetical protein
MPDYYGLPTVALENEYLHLEALAEGGLRIVRLQLPGQEANLLAEIPDVQWETPHGTSSPLGGHRLWLAPEQVDVTNLPDASRVEVHQGPDDLILSGIASGEVDMHKALRIRLLQGRAALTVEHTIRNHGQGVARYAPWGITMLPLGGEALLPLGPASADPRALLPDRVLVLWPYTTLADQRLHIEDRMVRITAEPVKPPMKVGTYNPRGWAGYLRAGVLFVKRFTPLPGSLYPDGGCNAESYTCDRFIELETLGPLAEFQPGQSASHLETWEIYTGVESREQAMRLMESA